MKDLNEYINFYSGTKIRCSENKHQSLIEKLWEESSSELNKASKLYFNKRRIDMTTLPESLRSHPALYESNSRQCYPGLVGKLQGYNSGGTFAIQRIYLTSRGEKANIHAPKKLLGKPSGGSVHIGGLKVGSRLALAEGIETALSFSQMYKIPTWACLSKNNLKNALVPPPAATPEIIIAGDNDNPGLEVAHAKATELKKVDIELRLLLLQFQENLTTYSFLN